MMLSVANFARSRTSITSTADEGLWRHFLQAAGIGLYALLVVLAALLGQSSAVSASIMCPAMIPVTAGQVLSVTADATSKTCISNGGAPLEGVQITVIDTGNLSPVKVEIVSYRGGTPNYISPTCTGLACSLSTFLPPETIETYPQVAPATIGYSYADNSGKTVSFSFTIQKGSANVASFIVSGGLFNVTAPTINSVLPVSGNVIGGTAVTIDGENLSGATVVMFGGIPAAAIIAVSPTQVIATAPAHSAGAVDIAVMAPAGTAKATGIFTYAPSTTFTTKAAPVTFLVNSFSLLSTSGGTGTGAVTYAVTSGPCTLGGAVLLSAASGTCTVTATKAADTFNPSATAVTTVSVTSTIGSTQQTAVAAQASPVSIPVGGTSYVSTTGGSIFPGNSSFTVTGGTGSCTIDARGKLTGKVAGVCNVTATLAGDAMYAPASGSVEVTVGLPAQSQFDIAVFLNTIASGQTITLSTLGGSGTGAVTYSSVDPYICSISGASLVARNPGHCRITANKSGGGVYATAQADLYLSVTSSSQLQSTLYAAVSPATIPLNGTATLSTTGGSGTGAVGYAVDLSGYTLASGLCAIVGNTILGVRAGPCTVNASKLGDSIYSQTSSANVTVIVTGNASQAALSAAASPAAIVVNGTSTLSTSGGSGTGAVSYAVIMGSANCSVSGNTLTGAGTGICTVTVTKAGDASYVPATATVNVTVSKGTQAPISVAATPTGIVVGGATALSISGGSGTGVVSYAVTAGGAYCSVAGATLTGTGIGACTVTATKAADANFNLATATVNVTVSGSPQAALSASATPATIALNGKATLATSGGSGTGVVSYAVTAGGSFCSMSGATLTGIGAGTCTVIATKVADANYFAATATVSVSVRAGSQTIAFTRPGDRTFTVGGAVMLVATASSGLQVSFASTTPVVCSVSGTTTSILSVGTCSIVANQPGNTNFAPAAPATQSFAINGIGTNVALTSSAATATVNQSITLTATVSPASAMGTVGFKDGATNLCSPVAPVSGVALCKISFAMDGTHGFAAEFVASGNYSGARSAVVNVTVGNPGKSGTPDTKATTAATRFLAQRSNSVVGNMFGEGRQVDRLIEFGNGQSGSSGQGAAPAGAFPPGIGGGEPSRLGPGPDVSDFARLRSGGRGPGATAETVGLRQGVFDESTEAGRPGSGLPAQITGSTDGANRFAFATSLSQISRYNAETEARKVQAGLSGEPGLSEAKLSGIRSTINPFDVWIEGKYSSFRDNRSNADTDGHFGSFSVGADYILNRSLLIGAFVELDSLQQSSRSQLTEARGNGWLAGPYATIKLSDNVFWQMRAGWGQSRNEISLTPAASDKFDGERRMASTSLSGRWDFGAWQFRPAASVSYMEETAKSYTDSNGGIVPGISSHLGQAKAGPEFSYRYQATPGFIIEPRFGLQGIWDFATDTKSPGIAQAGSDTAGAGGMRGRTEVGVRAQTSSGLGVDLSGSYDGIGSAGYSAISGRAAVRVPLN